MARQNFVLETPTHVHSAMGVLLIAKAHDAVTGASRLQRLSFVEVVEVIRFPHGVPPTAEKTRGITMRLPESVRVGLLLTFLLMATSAQFAHGQDGRPCNPFDGQCDGSNCPWCQDPPTGYCLGNYTCCELITHALTWCMDCGGWRYAQMIENEWWDSFGPDGCPYACGEVFYDICLQ